MHAAGIPVPHPLFESQGVVVMTGMRVMVQPMESSNSDDDDDDDDDGDDGIQSGPHQCQNRNQSFRSRQSEG